MKARRKSDGKVIEVKEIYPMGDEYIPFVQYYETEDGTICQDTDLDFSVGEEKEVEGVTIEGLVARDANGDLELYDGRYILERKNNLGYWTNGFDSVSLPDISFPSVTWESDPLEVTITIKPKKKQ